MLFKNILLGLGGTVVVGGGGYMIYNATKSGDENQTEDVNQAGATETPPTQSQSQQSSGSGGDTSPSTPGSSGGGASGSGNGAGSKK